MAKFLRIENKNSSIQGKMQDKPLRSLPVYCSAIIGETFDLIELHKEIRVSAENNDISSPSSETLCT